MFAFLLLQCSFFLKKYNGIFQNDIVRYHIAFSNTIVTAELLKIFMEFYQTRPIVCFKVTQRLDIVNVSYWSKADIERIYVNVEDLKIYYDIGQLLWEKRKMHEKSPR